MDKNEVLKILETAKDENGEAPMRLVRQAFEKLPEHCEDTISRRAAIDAVSRGCYELRGVFAECEKNLNELPSVQPEQRWIPVSERLPESKAAYYIVTLESRDRICVLPNDIDIARWDCDRRKGKDSWHWCKERKVIAWKPLPKPYNVNVEGK